jgi:hypothetical protein
MGNRVAHVRSHNERKIASESSEGGTDRGRKMKMEGEYARPCPLRGNVRRLSCLAEISGV